ncbi:MAG: hypothetical protein WCQ95_10520 [Bacteroidota bacterium]
MKINKTKMMSLVMMVFTVLSFASNAQVTVNLNIMPPYSPFYRDYAGFNHDYLSTNHTIVNLTSSTNVNVYLTASIKKDDNSISIQVRESYRPAMPISLVANIPKIQTGIQLKNIYGSGSTNDLILIGVTTNEVIYNQALPEGNYTVCIQARDFVTGEVLGESCQTIYIVFYEPPQITNPTNLTSVYSKYPQLVITSWACATPNQAGLRYRLRIVKLIPGIMPIDALKNSTQVVLDKSNLIMSTFMLDLASGVILDSGAAYAMQVTATSPVAYFKNNGESEPVVFYYKGHDFLPPGANGISLNFINPNANKNYVEINNIKPMELSWNWFDINKLNSKDTLFLNDSLYKQYGVVKYKLAIVNAKTQVGSGSKPIESINYRKVIALVGNQLKGNVAITQKQADSVGFANNAWYKATVDAYDVDNNLVATVKSVDFQYRKVKDEEPKINISVNAVLKYMFQDSTAATFNATHAPTEIQVLKKKSLANYVLPVVTIKNVSYYIIAQKTGTTDGTGGFHDTVSVPLKYDSGDDLYLRVKLSGKYYISDDFSLKSFRIGTNDIAMNLGTLVAQTYAYSLKVYVKKAYTSYTLNEKDGAMNVALADSIFNSDANPYEYHNVNGVGTMTYAVESKTLAEDIIMVMYRKNKQDYIPPIEGQLTDYSHTSGYVEVARGVTQIEKKPTGDVTYVKFNRLLASVFQGDEYYILALNGKNDPNKPSNKQLTPQINQFPEIHNEQDTPQNNSSNVVSVQNNSSNGVSVQNNSNNLHEAWNNVYNPYGNFIYMEDGFKAQEMPFKLSFRGHFLNRDSLYRNLTTNYDIVSTKPPTSLVKGRILYHWKSDNGDQMHPLANSSFKIVVDYIVDDKPISNIGSMSGNSSGYTISTKFFVPEGQDEYSEGMELLDFNKTMAIGATDAQGNFEVEVVNLNPKGPLGKGYVISKDQHIDIPTETEYDPFHFDPSDPSDIIQNPLTGGDPRWGLGDLGGSDYGYTCQLGLNISGREDIGIQNSINHDTPVSFNISTGYFVVGDGSFFAGQGGNFKPGINTPGPANAYALLNSHIANETPLVSFARVFRIVPDNPYIYPAKDTFAVQAFEARNLTNPQTCYVKEVKVQVHTTDMVNNDLDQMKVTVFRNLNDKTKDLPLGEGDGQYKYAQLISPQYKTTGETIDKTGAQNLQPGNNIFDEKFELLWPPTDNSANGWVEFSTLLAGFDNYYIEACSNPTGNKTYQATFSSVDTKVDFKNPDYWYGIKSPDTVIVKMKLIPLHSRALIRLLDYTSQQSISGNKGGKVRIINETWGNWDEKAVDKDGYVEFLATNDGRISNLPSPVLFKGYANGYKQAKQDTTSFHFNKTGDQFFYNYMLKPDKIMKGRIVNKDDNNKGVPSYIKVDSGLVVSTGTDGSFDNLPLPGVAGKKVFIIPNDIGFFDSLYVVKTTDVSKPIVDIGDFGVYRRKHRIKFIVTTANNYYLNDATVQMGDSIKKTKGKGVVTYNFENVSVNNYTFIIRGPDGQNYIPKILNLKNEESRDTVTKIVVLDMGSEVSGVVTLDGQPVKHAKVYIDVDQQTSVFNPFNQNALSNDANLIVAYSGSGGVYHLRGVPVNNQEIYLHATIDTNFTVNGDLQNAKILNHSGSANFSLSSFKKMLVNNLFGFPLSVEKIVPVNSDSSIVKITGLVHWSKAISNFMLDETSQVLRIEDVLYKATIVNNKTVGVAQDASVNIQGVTSLKFKYLKKYNVKLTASPPNGFYNIFNPPPLVISNDNDWGVIKGKVSIVDNSFNYPSTYLNFADAVNSFYFADKVNETSVNTTIGAITSAMSQTQTNMGYYTNYPMYIQTVQNYINNYQGQIKPRYYLSDVKGDSIKFKLIEFDAKASPIGSFIDENGKIHLKVSLKCHIDNAQPPDFRLKIDDMVLDNNKVYPASSISPITIGLENWTLSVKEWSFSTQEGGIVSSHGLINTKAIDIPFGKFVLRHDMFLMDRFALQNLQMAGGSITLQEVDTSNAAIVYDNKTGTDMQPHWRFSISGDPAAKLPALTGLPGILKLNYIQILSNNEMVFQLQQQSTPFKIRNNSLASFSPESIFNGPDYISIYGGLNVGAPRMSDIVLRVKYTNAQTMSLESVTTDFEGKGFVHFTSRTPGNNVPNITIDSKQITILGNVNEQPTPTFNPMQATFFAHVDGTSFYDGSKPIYKVELDKNFVTQLDKIGNTPSSKGHKLVISDGGMSVSGNDWSILTYQGMMSSNTSDTNTKPLFVKYAVMGDISADANGLEVSNIKTPFGAMKMVFDFVHTRMIGSISVSNIPLGATIINGTVETLFDPDGFYIAGGCSANVNIPSIVDGTYNMGFMVGSYPITNELWSVVNSFKNPAVQNNCYRKKYPNLSGIYFTLDRVIIDKSLSFDFILASGYVQANALIGADIWTNFSPFAIGMQAHVYAHAAAGLSGITGTSINGQLSALAVLGFDYDSQVNKFSANGTIDLGFSASITQSLVLTTISKDIDINCHATAGTGGFDFSFGSGTDVVKCP